MHPIKWFEQRQKARKVKQSYEELTEDLNYKERRADVYAKVMYYWLRNTWAFLTIILLGLTLWFTYWLVSCIGKGNLNFQHYTSFLDIVATDIIVNVLGLVAILYRFLFPSSEERKSNE